jgi:hypothetical protein
MLGRDELHRRLGYHPATEATIPHYEESRARVLELACHWDETLPNGRELALALTALQEALMWANAAVACSLAPLQDPAGRQPNPLVQQMERDRLAQELTVVVRIPDGLPPEVMGRRVATEVATMLTEIRAGDGQPRAQDAPQA